MNQPDTPVSPDDLQSAIAHHVAGRLAAAETLYTKILQRDPNEPDALNLLGVILQERGEVSQSIELISRAVQLDPDFPEALANLARAQHTAGRPQEAADNAKRAMTLDPDLAEAPIILCCALLALGDPAAAAEAGRRAVAVAPRSFDAWSNLGQALETLKDWHAAATAYQAALDVRPGTTTRVKLAEMLAELGQHETALHHLRQAAAQAPDDVLSHAALGFALQRSKDIPGSIAAYRRALELAPERAELWRLQGRNFDGLGRFDEAASCYHRSLELHPGSAEARGNLAKIGRLADGAVDIAQLGGTLADATAPTAERVAAGLALGSLHDKAGVYDRAFAGFQAANDLARAHYAAQNKAFDAERFRRDIDWRIATFDRHALTAAHMQGDPSELPVFVVGMPRSGTTLVEQIAASHRRVHGGGETMDMRDIIRRLEQRQPGRHPLLWEQTEVQRETDAHLNRHRAVAGDVDRVIDKLPDNVLLLGHIARLFPRARVIICRRDLRDICLSCYFEFFNTPAPWSLDLANCAARAAGIERLIAHWRSALPLRMLEVQYEMLVADLEGQSRRLIDFLGLEWDPACLEFHKTDRVVLSASQWQVRQPLYNRSVGRWRHYRKHLGPLLEGLKDLVPPDEGHAAAGPTTAAELAEHGMPRAIRRDAGDAAVNIDQAEAVMSHARRRERARG
jgi:tetratricopeptide (TPR) repeat protein